MSDDETRAMDFWKVGQLYRGTYFKGSYFLMLGRYKDRVYGVSYETTIRRKLFKGLRNAIGSIALLSPIRNDFVVTFAEDVKNAYYFNWEPVDEFVVPTNANIVYNPIRVSEPDDYRVEYDFWIVGETYTDHSTSPFSYEPVKVLAVGRDTVFLYGRPKNTNNDYAFSHSKFYGNFVRTSDGKTLRGKK